MSGGHFKYKQYELSAIADQIERAIEAEDEWTDETRTEMRRAIHALKIAETYVHRLDWLLSNDDSEESFHRRLKADLEKLDQPAVREGWVMVPRKETEAMTDAAHEAAEIFVDKYGEERYVTNWDLVYAAIIYAAESSGAAAPKEPT